MPGVSPASERAAPPTIGLIATLLAGGQSYRSAGIHTYCWQLLQHLPQVFAGARFVGYGGASAPDALLRWRRAPLSLRHPLARILWEQAALPLLLARERPALVHGLAYALPRLSRAPGVVTVHDLSFLRFPEAFPAANRLYLSRVTAASCRRARRVIAVSQATAADLTALLAIPPAKIEVIPNGVDASFRPHDPAAVAEMRRQQGWPPAFLLTVGTLEPRKNHLVLLEAYARYRAMAAQPLPLLIAGGKGWYYETIFARVADLGLTGHVHFLGFVPAALLPWLYNAAALFLYPSRYEGFGLPVAEALACATPTITTTASSLPEVAGAAALTLDPDDSLAWAHAMITLLADPERQAALRQAGLNQAQRFRWPQAAAATARVYQRILEETHV